MKLSTIKCPNCESCLEIEDEIDTFFCEYCGIKIALEGQSKAENKANDSTKDLEQKEKPVDIKDEEKNEKLTKKDVILVIGVLLFCVVFLGYVIWSFFDIIGSHQNRIAKKEDALHAIVASVKDDIENGDYSDAHLKADIIRWDANLWEIVTFSSQVNEWDTIRNELILEIRGAEKNKK